MTTLLTQKDIADRWQISIQSVEVCRREGVINSVKGVPGIRFRLSEIESLEGIALTRFSPIERKKFEREAEELKKRLQMAEELIAKFQTISTSYLYIKGGQA